MEGSGKLVITRIDWGLSRAGQQCLLRDSIFLSELTTEIANNNKMRGVESVRSYDDPQYKSQITRAVTTHGHIIARVFFGSVRSSRCHNVCHNSHLIFHIVYKLIADFKLTSSILRAYFSHWVF